MSKLLKNKKTAIIAVCILLAAVSAIIFCVLKPGRKIPVRVLILPKFEVGKVNAASNLTAILKDDRFDFSDAYFLSTG